MPAKDGPAGPADIARAVATDAPPVANTASPSESDTAAKFAIAVERNQQAAADVRRVVLSVDVEPAFVFRP